jgi:hypothetical protein
LKVEDVALITKNIDMLPSDIAKQIITLAVQFVATEETQEHLVPSFIHTLDEYKPAFLRGIARSCFSTQSAEQLSCSSFTTALELRVFQS